MHFAIRCFILIMSAATAGIAQEPAGQVASSSIGKIGQRQTRDEVTIDSDTMGRINSRIANRVQSRIRNRIDRNYDPQANTASPFKIAGEEIRASVRVNSR